jgi:integrase
LTQRRRTKGAGSVRQLPSGRWQARYTDSDAVLRAAPQRFDTKLDANAWLRAYGRGEVALQERQSYRFQDFAERWIATRELRPSTRSQYSRYLKSAIVPVLGDALLVHISPTRVRAWYDGLDPEEPTRRRRVYALLHAIMATAYADDLIDSNPCRLRAGKAPRKHRVTIATVPEVVTIAGAVPPRYKAMILLAAWCGLRFGELTELRRRDIDPSASILHVERAWILVDGNHIVGDPKTEAGKRTVHVPPHIVAELQSHLRDYVGPDPNSLIFSAANSNDHMLGTTLYKVWNRARTEAGRPELRFHDLRHTGATMAAATGATLADLMARMGHSTPGAAMIYQHSISDRDKAIATALSAMAGAVNQTAGPM